MKFLNHYFIIVGVVSLLSSCIVDTELKEVPKDFMSPENSFLNKGGFESGLADIYRDIRSLYALGDDGHLMLCYDLDLICYTNEDFADGNPQYNETMFWNTINKDNGRVRNHWNMFYSWILKSNIIIDRAEDSNIKWTEDEKSEIVAEAKFLRAFSYRLLANMWGDVPLVLNETAAAKFDYVRSPQMEVYQQCKTDLTEAVKYMKTVDQQPAGRAPRAAAYHLLSEINICMGDYQGAIAAASSVINDPNFYLMTERFGVRTGFTFTGYTYQGPQKSWGDVYWDLFQEGNMNWSDGNHEAIWNVQLDPRILGGGSDVGRFGLERLYNFFWWSQADKNGVTNWLRDTLSGRPAGGNLPTSYLGELIWQYKEDWNRDIRNSEYNVQREFYWTNPNGEFYGQRMSRENMGNPRNYGRLRPSFKKTVAAVHYGLFTDATSGQKHDDGRIFKDWYIMRMSETYLLRAEAYLRSGDKQRAADDINVVRSRSKATPVSDSDVDIDLILDERVRELSFEDFRLNTLMRMGKLVEYLMKYNGAVIQNSYQLPSYKNKFPIPQAEIEANKGGGLTQNTGYE